MPCFLAVNLRRVRHRRLPGRIGVPATAARRGQRPELERAGTPRPDARPAAERHQLDDATRTTRSPAASWARAPGTRIRRRAVNMTPRTRAGWVIP